jgi:diacylglycerol kinase family enzyme
MHAKNACLIINPRAGENVAKLPDILAVMAAAGWHTDILLKEFGGQTLELAEEAGKQKYDLVISYGGDGSLNQVVNGVMNAHSKRSSVAVIPGGTANVWAGEIGVPGDPVQAVLALTGSEARKVDVGHVSVESLTFLPSASKQNEETPSAADTGQNSGTTKKSKDKPSAKARQHFLLMAGLGIDAAIMSGVSKPLKYKIGPLAVGVSAVSELPKQHTFPIEIRDAGNGSHGDLLWKGEVLQVIVGNTRKYANVVEMTPNAYIDDGVLDVCVITGNDPLTTLEQITSLLLRRRPDNVTAEYFHGSHLVISAPATIAMQLDGSAVKLKDYLGKPERKALQDAANPDLVMVNYRFDAMPKALSVAIPASYNDALFEDTHGEDAHGEDAHGQNGHKGSRASGNETQQDDTEAKDEQQADEKERHANANKNGDDQEIEMPASLLHSMQQARKVKVVGIGRNPDRPQPFYIVAGGATKQATGETRPVAVRIDDATAVYRRTGERADPHEIETLHDGDEILVDGKKSKRGVIAAKSVVI